MNYPTDRKGPLLLALLLALPVAACEETPTDTLSADRLSADFVDANDVRPGDGLIEQEQVEVCKSGMDATFLIEILNRHYDGSPDENISYDVDIADGECKLVWESGGPVVDDVTVTEYVPAGYEASWVMDQLDDGVVTQTAGVGNQVVTYIAGRTGGTPTNAGAIVWFTNTPIPDGGEGCTPGYWKQDQHFGDWTGYLPSDPFTTPGFADAFPGMSLLDVAQQGGGGINALGRHAVAALLNATSSGVDYAYTEAEVVQMFNDAYNGSADINDTKDAFEMENEYGAPLCGFDDDVID